MPPTITRISAVFAAMPTLYIADGHHRSAAAARVAAARRGRQRAHRSVPLFFLAVIFPAAQMRIMDYNRVVRDLNGRTSEESFLGGGRLSAAPSASSSGPGEARAHQAFAACISAAAGTGSRFCPNSCPDVGAACRTRCAASTSRCLPSSFSGPLLGITDLRRDARA
jgi:hypothetical protein